MKDLEHSIFLEHRIFLDNRIVLDHRIFLESRIIQYLGMYMTQKYQGNRIDLETESL